MTVSMPFLLSAFAYGRKDTGFQSLKRILPKYALKPKRRLFYMDLPVSRYKKRRTPAFNRCMPSKPYFAKIPRFEKKQKNSRIKPT
jgi:hypothetical protein